MDARLQNEHQFTVLSFQSHLHTFLILYQENKTEHQLTEHLQVKQAQIVGVHPAVTLK